MSDSERDYMGDLNRFLGNLFAHYHVTFDLRSKVDVQDIHSYGSFGAVAQVMSKPTYTLMIRVTIDNSDLMTSKMHISSVDLMRRAFVGESFRPTSYKTEETYYNDNNAGYRNSLVFEYVINDLDDFMVELEKHSWREYSAHMNNLIDEKLSD